MQTHNKIKAIKVHPMYTNSSRGNRLEEHRDVSVVVSIMKDLQTKDLTNKKSTIRDSKIRDSKIQQKNFYNSLSKYFFRCIFLIVISFLFLPLSGCELLGLEESSVQNDPSKSGTRSERRKKVVEEENDEEKEFTYNPIGKRDPFRSFLAFASDNSIIDNIPRTPLQRYDIEQYTLTGIISGIDRPRALVEDPTGIGHVMELGDYIGTNWGKVTSIEDDIVIITEEYKTIEDELVTRPIKLTLRTSNNSGM